MIPLYITINNKTKQVTMGCYVKNGELSDLSELSDRAS